MDRRIGVNIDSMIDDQLGDICKRYGEKAISRGVFIEAMVLELDPAVRDAAVVKYLERSRTQKAEKKAQKKELDKLLAAMSPEDIHALIASQKSA